MKTHLLFYTHLVLFCAAGSLCAQEAKVVEKEGRVVMSKAGAKPAPAEIGAELSGIIREQESNPKLMLINSVTLLSS